MAWMQDLPGADQIGERTERALRLPLGAVSPLWAMFGAAATTGVAYWWLTQWPRAVNVEAMAGFLAAPARPRPPKAPARAEFEAAVAELVPAAQIASAEARPAPEAFEPPLEPSQAHASAGEEKAADDLTRMTGIGPKLARALAERGVTRFSQIAAWTPADVADVDTALNLKGRAMREAWVAQARRLTKDG